MDGSTDTTADGSEITPEDMKKGNTILALLIFQIFFFIIGIIFNAFIGVTFSRKRKLEPAEFFPYFMIVTDIYVLIAALVRTTIPAFYLIYVDNSIEGTFRFSKIESFGRTLYVPSVPLAVWMLTAAVAERYVTVYRPFKDARASWNDLDKKKAKIIAVIILIACEVLYVPFFIDKLFVSSDTKEGSSGYRYGMTYLILIGLYLVIGYFTPVILGFIFYLMPCRAQKPSQSAPDDTPLQNLQADSNAETENANKDVDGETSDETVLNQNPVAVTAENTSTQTQDPSRAIRILYPSVFLLVPWCIVHVRFYAENAFAPFDSINTLLFWMIENTLVMSYAALKFLVYRFVWLEFAQNFIKNVCCK